jgi:hypothetical protein
VGYDRWAAALRARELLRLLGELLQLHQAVVSGVYLGFHSDSSDGAGLPLHSRA